MLSARRDIPITIGKKTEQIRNLCYASKMTSLTGEWKLRPAFSVKD